MNNSKYIGFLDESGDHSLESIDKDFPVFVLALVIVERKDYVNTIIPAMGKLKVKYWNHEGINLHSSDIRKSRGDFKILFDTSIRSCFYSESNDIMTELPYKVIISAIKKDTYKLKYGERPQNPYTVALIFALMMTYEFLDYMGENTLPCIAEARGKNEDHDLERAFYKIL
ncbi:MAG: DUF3800 domain-containing protein [Spirochaetales bacterium]|nr:DUF3800 domain-containing protein [Spirochaetales bacterium]